MSRRLLLVAYQCGPGMGSVSQIGWEWYARLAASLPAGSLTLVTHIRNRASLEAAGAPKPGTEVVYIDSEWFAGPLYRLARRIFPRSEHSVFLVSSLDYFVFDLLAFRKLRQRQRDGAHWDLLHRVTPVTLSAPTWLVRLGVPTVLGPLNSGLTDPPGFRDILRQEFTGLIRLRGLTRVLDLAMGSTRKVARILVATAATRLGVPTRHRPRCRTMVENGVDLAAFPAAPWPAPPAPKQALRVAFVGRLVPVKGLPMLLRAVATLVRRGQPCVLDVVGDGPMAAAWRAEATALGLADVVHFHGAKPAAEVAHILRESHVLCLPSVRESGGAVILEAQACARPVIAFAYGGPAELVDEAVGRLLPMRGAGQAVEDLASALQDVITDPQAWAARGQAGRQRVEARHAWPAKIAAAESLYTEVLAERRTACC